MLRMILGIVLIGHALAHGGLAAAPIPGDPDPKPGDFFTDIGRSWLFQRLGLSPDSVKKIGIVLVIFSTIGFILAGLGELGVFGLDKIWTTVTGISAIGSMILLVSFWHPWLILGILLDAGLLILLMLNKFPLK